MLFPEKIHYFFSLRESCKNLKHMYSEVGLLSFRKGKKYATGAYVFNRNNQDLCFYNTGP